MNGEYVEGWDWWLSILWFCLNLDGFRDGHSFIMAMRTRRDGRRYKELKFVPYSKVNQGRQRERRIPIEGKDDGNNSLWIDDSSSSDSD